MFVQALGFAAGILLVRQLSKEEPAFFTVAITMQGTMNMLCDNGVGAEISAIGGGVWQSRQRFGQLITSALNMRRLAVLTTVIVTPVLLVLLLRKEATITHAALIAGAVLLGLYFQISIGVLQHVPFLNLQWQRLQKINFWSSALRLLVLGAAYYTVLDAVTALLATTVTSAAIHFHLRHWVPELIDMTAPENPEHRRKLVGLVKSQAPNGIFFCFQSQITIWLINIFGSASSLADVGALGAVDGHLLGGRLGGGQSGGAAFCPLPGGGPALVEIRPDRGRHGRGGGAAGGGGGGAWQRVFRKIFARR